MTVAYELKGRLARLVHARRRVLSNAWTHIAVDGLVCRKDVINWMAGLGIGSHCSETARVAQAALSLALPRPQDDVPRGRFRPLMRRVCFALALIGTGAHDGVDRRRFAHCSVLTTLVTQPEAEAAFDRAAEFVHGAEKILDPTEAIRCFCNVRGSQSDRKLEDAIKKAAARGQQYVRSLSPARKSQPSPLFPSSPLRSGGGGGARAALVHTSKDRDVLQRNPIPLRKATEHVPVFGSSVVSDRDVYDESGVDARGGSGSIVVTPLTSPSKSGAVAKLEFSIPPPPATPPPLSSQQQQFVAQQQQPSPSRDVHVNRRGSITIGAPSTTSTPPPRTASVPRAASSPVLSSPRSAQAQQALRALTETSEAPASPGGTLGEALRDALDGVDATALAKEVALAGGDVKRISKSDLAQVLVELTVADTQQCVQFANLIFSRFWAKPSCSAASTRITTLALLPFVESPLRTTALMMFDLYRTPNGVEIPPSPLAALIAEVLKWSSPPTSAQELAEFASMLAQGARKGAADSSTFGFEAFLEWMTRQSAPGGLMETLVVQDRAPLPLPPPPVSPLPSSAPQEEQVQQADVHISRRGSVTISPGGKFGMAPAQLREQLAFRAERVEAVLSPQSDPSPRNVQVSRHGSISIGASSGRYYEEEAETEAELEAEAEAEEEPEAKRPQEQGGRLIKKSIRSRREASRLARFDPMIRTLPSDFEKKKKNTWNHSPKKMSANESRAAEGRMVNRLMQLPRRSPVQKRSHQRTTPLRSTISPARGTFSAAVKAPPLPIALQQRTVIPSAKMIEPEEQGRRTPQVVPRSSPPQQPPPQQQQRSSTPRRNVRVNRHGSISIGHSNGSSYVDAEYEPQETAEDSDLPAPPLPLPLPPPPPRLQPSQSSQLALSTSESRTPRPNFFGSLSRESRNESSPNHEKSNLRKTIRTVLRRLRHTATNAEEAWTWIDEEKRNSASGMQFVRGLDYMGVDVPAKEMEGLFNFLGGGRARITFPDFLVLWDFNSRNSRELAHEDDYEQGAAAEESPPPPPPPSRRSASTSRRGAQPRQNVRVNRHGSIDIGSTFGDYTNATTINTVAAAAAVALENSPQKPPLPASSPIIRNILATKVKNRYNLLESLERTRSELLSVLKESTSPPQPVAPHLGSRNRGAEPTKQQVKVVEDDISPFTYSSPSAIPIRRSVQNALRTIASPIASPIPSLVVVDDGTFNVPATSRVQLPASPPRPRFTSSSTTPSSKQSGRSAIVSPAWFGPIPGESYGV